MRSFVVLSALFAVGLCGVLPGGYNYNSGSTFNHNAVVGPAFAASNNVQQVSGLQAPVSTGFEQQSVSGPSTGFTSFTSGPSGTFGSATVQQPAVSTVSGFPSGSTGGLTSFSSGPSGTTGGLSSFTSGPSGSFGSATTVGQPAVSTVSGNGFSGNGFQSGPVGSPSIGAPVFQQSGQFVDSAPIAHHEAPLITKQFYLHSAPEDHDSIGKSKHFVLGRAQKNYRVVFIKSPSSSNANVHLSAEYAPQEEKTVIYVLSQKEHELDVNDIATPAPTQPSKPEVFFIKYKTPEEAAHAQNEIQRQYDVLGGQSHVSDEGHAPVSDVSGALTPATHQNQQSNVGYLPPATNQNYLPPQK